MARFLSWLLLDRDAGRRAAFVSVILIVVQAALLAAAAASDNALWLPGRDIGLLEHPGIPTILVADSVALALLGFAARRFLRLPGRLPVSDAPSSRRLLRRAVSRGRSVLLLRGRAGALFWFAAGVGTLFWLQNALQTRRALEFYGHDVFDSSAHPASYVVFRVVLWGSWAILYPYVAVAFLGISGTVYRATATLARRGRLTYRAFHPDRSGGYATIGDISFATIMAILALYTSLAVVIVTHHRLNILQISGLAILSVALVLLTFFIAWPVGRFMWRRQRRERRDNYRRLSRRPDEFAALSLMWIGSGTSYSPYAKYQVVLINGARLLPVVIAFARVAGAI
ncbi:hypothetical protein [Bosea sp. (in: a-proteobacteria)]|uniref:hypothetical protein n=1 Tax=Bosea sp. (in: a-proteobacteria) TaxID=1871050 RepID=UPI0012142B45|nr:hypothetical protein [Bosea sp. (in: a-proteobacteria)]TAJ33647.1 MAG: hypothetical protein EPO59_04570 [Bosea sp. (in: a-proteobacteria)]